MVSGAEQPNVSVDDGPILQHVVLPIADNITKPKTMAAIEDGAAVDGGIIDLDIVLSELGSMGRFQIMIFSSLLLPVMLFSMYETSYMFTTGRLDYRCQIPECDSLEPNVKFKPDWIARAVPMEANGKPSQCLRYVPDTKLRTDDLTCPGVSFNRSQTEQCGDFVYATDEVTLVNEFNITCPENEWRLSIIGSLGYAADIVMVSLSGYLSDRFGRRTIIAVSLLSVVSLGMVKTVATSYAMFVGFEILLCLCTPGSFHTLFIMMVEWVVPEKRILGGTFICIAYSFGQISLGIVSAYVTHFRWFMCAIYAPALLVLSYIWLVPESVRWMHSKGLHKRVRTIIERAARMNGVTLSKGAQEFLRNADRTERASALALRSSQSVASMRSRTRCNSIVSAASARKLPQHESIFSSRRLFVRMLICAFCMFANNAIYIGLNVHSVFLSGSKHFNYIAVNIIEVPANIIAYFVMMGMGRRLPFGCSLLSTAVLCLLAEHVPVFEHANAVRLTLFVASKLCITVSESIVMMYVSEMFPTCLRQSFMNSCYALSCLGSMTAPQIALLYIYMPSLPMYLFALIALMASGLVMLLPETYDNKLPDTIEEAEQIGRELKSSN